MGKAHAPRSGSMQFWPRVRAKREYPRIRSWPTLKDSKLLGFAGYKVGMTHVMAADNRKNSPTKGSTISVPVTIVECPPIKVIGARFYKKYLFGVRASEEVFFKGDDTLKRRISVSRKVSKSDVLDSYKEKSSEFADVRAVVQTMPSKTGIGKKKPEVFEVALGGNFSDKIEYLKNNAEKELNVSEIFNEGSVVDIKAVTKGKGYQGPVKRFGIGTRAAKSEKAIRNPGSLGGWIAQQHTMYRIAHAGKMGYHTRTEYNKIIMKISDNAQEVNPKGGFINYGVVKNSYILIKGSVGGPKKRMIRFNFAIRPSKGNLTAEIPTIKSISLDSKQGN
jgi:large subunit ribosomal protein L3